MCPFEVPPIIKEPLFGQSLLDLTFKTKWRRYIPPPDQLNWDLVYGVTAGGATISFAHKPRPPNQCQHTVGFTKKCGATPSWQPSWRLHRFQRKPMSSLTPSLMPRIRGLSWDLQGDVDPGHATVVQTYQYGHITGHNGDKLLYEGPGAASRGETAGDPRPRTRFPDDMLGYARGQGVPIRELGATTAQPNYTMHHHHASCLVWDCGKVLLASSPYDKHPFWGHSKRGNPVSIPLDGTAQRYTFSDYGDLCTALPVNIQKECSCCHLLACPDAGLTPRRSAHRENTFGNSPIVQNLSSSKMKLFGT